MAVRPLRWWSDTQLVQLAKLIEHEWVQWSANWGLTEMVAETLAVSCQLAHETEQASDSWLPLLAAASSDRQLWLSAEQALEQSVFVSLFGELPKQYNHLSADSSASNVVAWQIVKNIVDDWYSRLTRLCGSEYAAQELTLYPTLAMTPPKSEAARWSGAVRIDITSPIIKLPMYASAHVAAVMIGATGAARSAKTVTNEPPLTSLKLALANQILRLRVELNDVELDLGSLQSLAEGDVIRLPHLLSQALSVHMEGHRGICAAYLGQTNGMRAVELIRQSGNLV